MILLYDEDKTKQYGMGYGDLAEASSCIVKEELNGQYELTVTYPQNGIRSNDIKNNRILMVKPNKYDNPQKFRIYSITKNMDFMIEIRAQHISYDTSGYVVKGTYELYAEKMIQLLSYMKENTIGNNPFTLYNKRDENMVSPEKISLGKPASFRSYIGGENSLISHFGGELIYDNYDIQYVDKRGTDTDIYIEYGKNLMDFTQDEIISSMYKYIYPYYYSQQDGLQTLDSQITINSNLKVDKCLAIDLTDKFDEMPSQDSLNSVAMTYVAEHKLAEPEISMSITHFNNPEVISQLTDIKLGDVVNVIFSQMGVNTKARCISYEYNVITNTYENIGLGTLRFEITNTISETIQTESNHTSVLTQHTKEISALTKRIEVLENKI